MLICMRTKEIKTTLVSLQSQYDIYIGRPSKWGNPFARKNSKFPTYIVNSVIEAVGCYAIWAPTQFSLNELEELRGKRLACWCKPGQPCHGQVLVALAENQKFEYDRYVCDRRYAEILAAGMR